MRQQNELKMEVLLVSKYCEVVQQILQEHGNLSLNKMLFFAYLLKNEKTYSNFNAKTKKNIEIKALSQITGNFDDYCKNIEYILESIHLLLKSETIILQSCTLYQTSKCNEVLPLKNAFIKRAIIESEKYSDKQFLKEVINNDWN